VWRRENFNKHFKLMNSFRELNKYRITEKRKKDGKQIENTEKEKAENKIGVSPFCTAITKQ
jgi:hypothetical protein